jgi:hypothetical protein
LDAYDYIENYCKSSPHTDPGALINEIMKNSAIKMHGPEHHFLVPAVLITSYYNHLGNKQLLNEKLRTAKKRSKQILGGFCGFYGTCGAGIGTGIFFSLIQNATPLSTSEWQLCNMATAKSLEKIACHGGPRCCKRDSFLAIETAVEFLNKHLKTALSLSIINCGFSDFNRECRKEDCRYFKVKY